MAKNLGGRPCKPFDKKLFEKLCGIQCTEAEICAHFGMTDKTLTARCKETYGMGFSEVSKLLRKDGHIAIRNNLFNLAKKNVNAAKLLASKYLGIVETQRVETEVSFGDRWRASSKRAKDILAEEEKSGS